MTYPLMLLAAGGGITGNASLLLMIVACVLFAICLFMNWGGPQPNPWISRVAMAGFFFWTLSIVVSMLGGL